MASVSAGDRTTEPGETALEEPPSVAVARAVATAEGVSVESLPVRIREAIDPEALDALVGTGDCTVGFAVGDHEVTVDASGGAVDVTVR